MQGTCLWLVIDWPGDEEMGLKRERERETQPGKEVQVGDSAAPRSDQALKQHNLATHHALCSLQQKEQQDTHIPSCRSALWPWSSGRKQCIAGRRRRRRGTLVAAEQSSGWTCLWHGSINQLSLSYAATGTICMYVSLVEAAALVGALCISLRLIISAVSCIVRRQTQQWRMP